MRTIISTTILSLFVILFVLSCTENSESEKRRLSESDSSSVLEPLYITQPTPNDTDDPAIYIDPTDINNSFIIGTDKDKNGGLYAYDLKGNIIEDKPYLPLQRPNNVDIEYGFSLNGESIDIAAVTERNTNKLRIVSLPDFQFIDKGGIDVFEDDTLRSPMGVSLYKGNDNIYAIVSRKSGPTSGYLYQYTLEERDGSVMGTFVRKFGTFSGIKEIESIAIDDEKGFVYYSDEGVGVRKYNVHPDSSDTELALIGSGDFAEDNEGISIYDNGNGGGYLIVSDQQAGKFNFYDRNEPHEYKGSVNVKAVESDGSETYSLPLGNDFPGGLFVAMSDDKTFHYYKLDEMIAEIEKSSK